MPLVPRTPQSDPGAVGPAPIARNFALVLLAALIVLVVLRHLFGSVRVEVGTK